MVAAAVGRWSEQLMDVAGRNALLHYRDLKVGTLDLARADGTARGAMATGRTVPLARLFPDPQAHADAVKRARAIRNKARELYEERGIETCYLAMGSATWTNPKGGAVPVAPVLLRSAVLRAHGAAEEDFDLTVTADAEVNPVLVHVLGTEFDVRFDAELVADLEPAEAFERIAKEAAGRVRGFAISAREVIGTFSYAKLPMVTDLAAAVDALKDHDVVAAIAGDPVAQTAVRVPAGPSDPDSLPPSAEFLVLDADSSQHAAIDAVLSGQHAVIKGPPGTGKSQTIANLITSLVARGRRVLFVAEKRAAITAVTDRLARRGLGQLVMDVHDGTSARRRIAADLKNAYESAARTALPDLAELHETLVDRRSRLAEHVIALHEPREPWGVSVFEAQSALLGSPPPLPVRLRGSHLQGVTEVTARQVREALREYASLGGLGPAASPWHESTVHSGEQAQEAWLAAGRLANATRALEPVFAALESVGLARPQRLVELRSARALVDGVTATLLRFDPAVYDEPLADLVAACADQAWRSANGVHIGWWKARRLRQRAAVLGRAEMDRDELFRGLLAAHGQRQRWPSTPTLPAEWDAVRRVHDRVETDITTLDACLPAVDLTTLAWPDLTAYAARLAADDRALRRQPHRLQLAAQLADAGVQEIVDALRSFDGNPVLAFDAVWYASIVEHVGFLDPRIGGFDAVAQERIVSEYRAADAAHLDSSARRVLRAVAEHIVAVRERFPEQDRLVEHQASLKRRHLPMRQLFATAPNVLTALKPCWAMSPLVVSQLLPADGQYFDVVIFDEASQVTPADAVPAILRARQVVVAGDEHQLPPTAFFAAATDGDGAVGVTADGAIDLSLTSGYESILDVLTALLPAYMLRWHYRSRDDRLIGFSNEWIYDRSLVTFPGTASAGRLTHVLVSGVSSSSDDGESAPSEVDRVVELVLSHASERPRESLGVIAMGVTHADRIDRALRLALAGRPELHGFFAENAAEPFFVKNLERVQGDERDAIILSVGYGKTADGRLLYRFGPLLTAGGERRLNVAITRARGRMTVVSSFSAADMDPARATGRGVALLREYLSYAALGGAMSAVAAADPVPLTPFDRDVLDRLTAAGVPVLPRYGLSGQHIEFAATHPTRPDRMALAVETDGPVYRAAGTVRDRDRLRPTQLERLGWRVHRIWSTDWFTDPEPEVARAVSAYHDAILDLDPPEPAPAVVPAAPEPAPAVVPNPPEPVLPEPPAVQEPPEPPSLPELPALVEPPAAAPGDPPAVAADAGSGHPRTARPPVPVGLPIAGYRHADLVALIRWIESDTLLRTEDEVLEEVMRELGFSRKGPRIREAISRALAAARATR